MKPLHTALAISVVFHLAIYMATREMGLSPVADERAGKHDVLNISFQSNAPAVEVVNTGSVQPESVQVVNNVGAPEEVQVPANHQSAMDGINHVAALPTPESQKTEKPGLVKSVGDQQVQIAAASVSQVAHKAMVVRRVHPGNWIALMVKLSEDGAVLEYDKVSREDPNSALYMMLVNEAKSMKYPESLFGQKILVSGPPLKIETDPELLAEYFP